jgi:hypothetical protein
MIKAGGGSGHLAPLIISEVELSNDRSFYEVQLELDWVPKHAPTGHVLRANHGGNHVNMSVGCFG